MGDDTPPLGAFLDPYFFDIPPPTKEGTSSRKIFLHITRSLFIDTVKHLISKYSSHPDPSVRALPLPPATSVAH